METLCYFVIKTEKWDIIRSTYVTRSHKLLSHPQCPTIHKTTFLLETLVKRMICAQTITQVPKGTTTMEAHFRETEFAIKEIICGLNATKSKTRSENSHLQVR